IDYRPPPGNVLEKGRAADKGPDPRDHDAVGRRLVETLGHFGVEAKIVGIVSGPHVSRYELRLAPGTKVKKVTELANDLAYALASTDIRILPPIPGTQAVAGRPAAGAGGPRCAGGGGRGGRGPRDRNVSERATAPAPALPGADSGTPPQAPGKGGGGAAARAWGRGGAGALPPDRLLAGDRSED